MTKIPMLKLHLQKLQTSTPTVTLLGSLIYRYHILSSELTTTQLSVMLSTRRCRQIMLLASKENKIGREETALMRMRKMIQLTIL